MITNHTVSFFGKVHGSRAWYLSMPVMRMAYHPYQLNHAQQFCRNIGSYRAMHQFFFLPFLVKLVTTFQTFKSNSHSYLFLLLLLSINILS